MSYLQAVVIGLLQGITELFPISSLGHSLLLPAFLDWDNLTGAQAASVSFYLACLVGIHVGTAIALLIYFRETWRRIVAGFLRTLRCRKIASDERLAWLLIIATLPAGLVGLLPSVTTGWIETRTLIPFAIYSVVVGSIAVIRFG